MNSMHHRVALLSVLALFLVGIGCGSDDDGDGGTNPGTNLDVPQDWWGEWQQIVTETPCQDSTTPTFFRGDATADTFTVCPDEFDLIDDDTLPGVEIDCTETVNGNSIRLVCSGTTAAFEGCDFTYDFDATATLDASGDSYTFTGSYSVTSSTGCGEFAIDECTDLTGTGTRISTNTDDCDGDGGDDGGDDGGGDGGGETGATITVSGGSGPSSADFLINQSATSYFEGAGWTIGGSAVLAATSIQVFAIGIDDGVATGTPVTMIEGGGEAAARFEFGELRNGVEWDLESFSGALTLSQASASRLAGTFTGTGVMLSENEDAENVTISGSFDSEVTPIDLRAVLGERVDRAVRRALVARD